MDCVITPQKKLHFLSQFLNLEILEMQFSRLPTWKSAGIFIATDKTVLSRLNKKNHSKSWKRLPNPTCDFKIR